uniref:Peptide-methionine (R)-S-oxide reductase n=1 Tax=Pyramimonas obovata TaxID=1411642 RepID=A0A6T7Y0U2_9CHLO|mmetsp:Transcript_39081/g.85035  ORF Transcript_39081/g.85035 Transcript_39081/m.85035 type:complete len:234 (+) Transcript_39081:233-934(+)|eukprot:CAMPEP_0118945046 /NCGR_PEP_ID=MMETSP1169-20130426/41509_1 /TAXON_ID=36882 /ORGANISM="Pyramimonas obovata, Strain CCMP722" /LENGTH=233 /DNA_ID=CAMNT_0006890675 /DNA_START=1002 /DNA_END=1703 /DNA_ORIENTATION=-
MQTVMKCATPVISVPLRTSGIRAKVFFGSARRSFAIQSRPLSLRRSFTTRAEAVERVEKSESEWKSELSDMEYYVLRQKGTERPRTGEYDKFYPTTGYFKCAGCGNPLYSAESKFNSGCGWPAFDKCYVGSVKTEIDSTMGMRRIEIMCAKCDGHLGHVFEGERMTPTNERHCVNSVSTKFVEGEPPVPLDEDKVAPEMEGLASEGGIGALSGTAAAIASALLVWAVVKILLG